MDIGVDAAAACQTAPVQPLDLGLGADADDDVVWLDPPAVAKR